MTPPQNRINQIGTARGILTIVPGLQPLVVVAAPDRTGAENIMNRSGRPGNLLRHP
jgi:hypothetical protein